MKISVKTLRDCSNKLFDHLEEAGHSYIELESDFYWSFYDADELFNPLEDPKKIGLGQLYDDYEWIKGSIDRGDEPVMYDAVLLSSLLRYIGEKVPS